MDMTNPTYGWSSDSFDQMLSGAVDWTSMELDTDLSLDSSLESHVTWGESSLEYASASEYISSSEWTSSEQESSSSLSAWFINTEEHWVVDEPEGLSDESLIAGVEGVYEISHDLYPTGRNDWHHVEIIFDHDKGSFTWENLAGVRWTLSPIQGFGGWDTSKLSVGSDNPYFNEGYTFASIEWVSSEYHEPTVYELLFLDFMSTMSIPGYG